MSNKWSTYWIKKQQNTHTQTQSHHMICFFFPLISACDHLFVSLLFPHSLLLVPSQVPHHLFLSSLAGSFCLRRHSGDRSLCSAPRMGAVTCPACLTDIHQSRFFSFPNTDTSVSVSALTNRKTSNYISARMWGWTLKHPHRLWLFFVLYVSNVFTC